MRLKGLPPSDLAFPELEGMNIIQAEVNTAYTVSMNSRNVKKKGEAPQK